jgi:DNA-binding transcriptional ArsR family regulator
VPHVAQHEEEAVATVPATPTISPMGTLRDVLEALSDPVRLEMVRRLADHDAPVACADLYDSISKSTASHHFKVLREAGLTERLNIGGQTHQRLRVHDLEESFPGVVSSIVAAS